MKGLLLNKKIPFYNSPHSPVLAFAIKIPRISAGFQKYQNPDPVISFTYFSLSLILLPKPVSVVHPPEYLSVRVQMVDVFAVSMYVCVRARPK